jgi:hypothetical protein
MPSREQDWSGQSGQERRSNDLIAADVRRIRKPARSLATHQGQSGRGQPHSKTSRSEWLAIGRGSVLERGCPLLLSVRPREHVIVFVDRMLLSLEIEFSLRRGAALALKSYLITRSSAVHMILSGPAERISVSLADS